MMDTSTGAFTELDRAEFDRFLRGDKPTPDGQVLVSGTLDEITSVSRRIRLGNQEVERRAARRRQQKDSRRRNR